MPPRLDTRFDFRISRDELLLLEQLAQEQAVSVSELVRRLVTDFLADSSVELTDEQRELAGLRPRAKAKR
jgi:hypothetical protein